MLWLQEHHGFGVVLKKHGIAMVLSVLGMRSAPGVALDSLLRLNGLLVGLLVDDVRTLGSAAVRLDEQLTTARQRAIAGVAKAREAVLSRK